MNPYLIRTLLAALALNFCACTSFDREWRLWSPQTPPGTNVLLRKTGPPPTPQSPFDGRWEGKWASERHHKPFSNEAEEGTVRCVFTRMDPYRYRANFRATWLNFRSEYLVTLNGRRHGTTLHLHGTQPVSRIFGDFRYDGTVTPTHFSLRYDARYDSGTMEMRKVR